MNNNQTPKELLSTLSLRQLEVLQLVCQGKEYKKIGKKLFISENTVKTHMGTIYKKLDLLDLDRNDRIFKIRSVYCPMLKDQSKKIKRKKTKSIDPDLDPEPITPEEDEMLMTDQSAMKSLNKNQTTKNLQSDNRKGTNSTLGCIKIFGFIFLLGLAAFGMFFIWQQIQQGVSDAISLIPTSDIAPAVPTVSFVTDIASADDEQANDKPGSSSAPDGIKEIGEWYKEGDLWLRVQNFSISSNSNYIEKEYEIC